MYREPVASSESNIMRKILGIAAIVVTIICISMLGRLAENVNAKEIVVIQAPFSGKLTWATQPGVVAQWFGSVTSYLRRDIYEFDSIKVQFNDGGHATIKGSIQFDMPLDNTNLDQLHKAYGSTEAIKAQVIQKVVDKVLYMTGPLMSARESYAEKKTDLIHYVQDQIDNGVYKTQTRQVEELDQMTGAKKTSTVATVALDPQGVPIRQESSVVSEFGIRAFNFAISSVDYEDAVDNQITQQQQIIMGVQTAIAQSRMAEQQAITAEQEGKATAAKAKWEQETIKAKAIVQGEQARDIAKLKAEEAAAYKTEQLLRADADATYKRQVLNADGALTQKLATLVEINKVWAVAFQGSQQPLVPQIQMGGSSGAGNGMSSAQQFMELLTAGAARDLGLSLRPTLGGGSQR